MASPGHPIWEIEAMKLGRRALLSGTGMAAAGAAGWWWWNGEPAVPEADRAARTPHEICDRGLVPVEQSGWTMPEGVHAPWPQLEADIEADMLVVGAGLAGCSLALHLAEAGLSVALLEAPQPGRGGIGAQCRPCAAHPARSKRVRTLPGQGQALP